jgi:FKBP-type peptidyl-prolyl cis-trans isomerase SlyD
MNRKQESMTIAKDKMVSLTYDLRLDGKESEIFESAGKETPLVFLYGAGMMLPAFEAGLLNKSTGDRFEIEIPANEAYGEENEEAIVDLPKHIFEVNGKVDEEMLTPGNSIPMMSSNGQRMQGMVVSVDGTTVKMDFNHPLAGEDLHFTGEILDVRDATEQELSAAYSTGGGCSGGCGCGEGGDCNSEGCGCGDSHGSGCGCS